MKVLWFFLLVSLSRTAIAQEFHYVLDNTVPVQENGADYASPWDGGLNSPQYNTLDLNFDNKDDLVLYDRMGQKVITYLQENGRYVYAPEFERFFPSAIYNWLLIRDFNCDGKKDIFTGHVFGISVYENVSTSGEMQWRHFPFYDGNSTSEVVLTQGLSGRINLQIQFDDLPAISDADGDGDMDIFVMNYGGSGTIQYHRNYGVERHGSCDSLDFELEDPWWGGVRECECDEFAYGNADCSSGGRVEHAGGKSLTLFDADGDGFKDILIAEAECPVLNMLDNNGPVDNPIVSSAPVFPAGAEPFNIFPTGYFEDVDFDGVVDLVVTPNIFSKPTHDINLKESNWFYKNVGTTAAPEFVLGTRAFLQQNMLDIGDHAVPAFMDTDGDGDSDLFISNNESPATISLFRNTGTPFEPRFSLAERDYLGLSKENFILLKAQFADIDSDGKTDLVFVATSTADGLTSVYYVLNKHSSGVDFSGQPIQKLSFQVARGENISFLQVDNDGRVDILRGRSNGSVEYWRNTGVLTFNLANPAFLNMTANVVSTRVSFAAADLDMDGSSDLLLGDETGQLRIISNFRNAKDVEEAHVNIVASGSGANALYAPNLGGRIWPATAPLYGGKPVVATGTILGGVRLLRSADDESPATLIKVYPNPLRPASEKLTIVSNHAATMQVFSAKGDVIRPSVFIPEKEAIQLTMNDFAAGIYLLRFSVGDKIHVRRLVVY